jgi:hypothetical protein
MPLSPSLPPSSLSHTQSGIYMRVVWCGGVRRHECAAPSSIALVPSSSALAPLSIVLAAAQRRLQHTYFLVSVRCFSEEKVWFAVSVHSRRSLLRSRRHLLRSRRRCRPKICKSDSTKQSFNNF